MSWLPMESFMKFDFSFLQYLCSPYFSLLPLLSIKQENPQVFSTFPLQQPHIIPKCSCCFLWSFTFYFHCPDFPFSSPSPMVDYESGQHHSKSQLWATFSYSVHPPASNPSTLVATLSKNRYFDCVFSSSFAYRSSASLNKV